MTTKRRTLLLRILSRILAPRRGEVRAHQEAMHLEGVVRFVGVILATIILPSLILAGFSVRAITNQDAELVGELERQAEEAAGNFWREVDEEFSQFEQRTRDQLEAGRSPLESARGLHPHLLVALQLNAEGDAIAPFIRQDDIAYPTGYLIHPIAQRAAALEATDPVRAGRLYAELAEVSISPGVRGRAELDRSRMLLKEGRRREAEAVLRGVAQRYPLARDPWGFRLGDLARLKLGEMLLSESPEAGTDALESLISDLLSDRWTIGQGGEAAVVRQALSWLEPSASREWSARIRGQVAERAEMLFWAGELSAELGRLPMGRLTTSPAGELRWSLGERGLWAVTRWDDDLYVFGLDLEAILGSLKADVRAAVPSSAPIEAYLIPPGEPIPTDVLDRRSLAPWLNDWSVVAAIRDVEALAAEQRRARLQRVGSIGFAMVMMIVGTVVSGRLITRELDVARIKTDFAANVSHELRSPITQIRLKAESLMLGLFEGEEELDGAYQVILRESERLSRLVDNVLDYSAIERGSKEYVLRPGSLAETMDRAVESVRATLEVREMDLDVNVPYDLPPVHHDPDAITQCIVNLISNAAKYSQPGCWIKVLGRRVEGGVEIAVSDQGIGIAPHDLRLIFEPHYRSRDALARRRKGTGLGLFITRYIMEAHGGTVSVQSRPGKGSTFTLRFPLQPPGHRGGYRRGDRNPVGAA